MTDWPEYESYKIVRAARIVRVEERESASGSRRVNAIWIQPEEGAPEEVFEPTDPAMMDRAWAGGWAVLYPDGFKSVSPRLAFEQGYRRKS